MANNEESVHNDPNFAVICSFLDKFGELCGIPNISIEEIQEKLEDTKEVCPEWVDLHVRLLRKAGKRNVTHEKWEKALIKFCHSYSQVDAWEIERFGYKKAQLSVKVNLFKHILQAQFDGNSKFKTEVNKLTSEELRLLPIGRDVQGLNYWYQLDKDLNFRIYREDQDEESWELIAKEKSDLVKLIETLGCPELQVKKEESTTTSENDDSKDSCAAKPKLDTGQEQETKIEEQKAEAPSSSNESKPTVKAEEAPLIPPANIKKEEPEVVNVEHSVTSLPALEEKSTKEASVDKNSQKAAIAENLLRASVTECMQTAAIAENLQKAAVAHRTEKAAVADTTQKAANLESTQKATNLESTQKAAVAENSQKTTIAKNSQKAPEMPESLQKAAIVEESVEAIAAVSSHAAIAVSNVQEVAASGNSNAAAVVGSLPKKGLPIRESVIKLVDKAGDIGVKESVAEEKATPIKKDEKVKETVTVSIIVDTRQPEGKKNIDVPLSPGKDNQTVGKDSCLTVVDTKEVPISKTKISESNVHSLSTSDSRMQPVLEEATTVSKSTESVSPIKPKHEALKEKMKSERMIPFKKREIPKDVDVEDGAETSSLVHNTPSLTVGNNTDSAHTPVPVSVISSEAKLSAESSNVDVSRKVASTHAIESVALKPAGSVTSKTGVSKAESSKLTASDREQTVLSIQTKDKIPNCAVSDSSLQQHDQIKKILSTQKADFVKVNQKPLSVAEDLTMSKSTIPSKIQVGNSCSKVFSSEKETSSQVSSEKLPATEETRANDKSSITSQVNSKQTVTVTTATKDNSKIRTDTLEKKQESLSVLSGSKSSLTSSEQKDQAKCSRTKEKNVPGLFMSKKSETKSTIPDANAKSSALTDACNAGASKQSVTDQVSSLSCKIPSSNISDISSLKEASIRRVTEPGDLNLTILPADTVVKDIGVTMKEVTKDLSVLMPDKSDVVANKTKLAIQSGTPTKSDCKNISRAISVPLSAQAMKVAGVKQSTVDQKMSKLDTSRSMTKIKDIEFSVSKLKGKRSLESITQSLVTEKTENLRTLQEKVDPLVKLKVQVSDCSNKTLTQKLDLALKVGKEQDPHETTPVNVDDKSATKLPAKKELGFIDAQYSGTSSKSKTVADSSSTKSAVKSDTVEVDIEKMHTVESSEEKAVVRKKGVQDDKDVDFTVKGAGKLAAKDYLPVTGAIKSSKQATDIANVPAKTSKEGNVDLPIKEDKKSEKEMSNKVDVTKTESVKCTQEEKEKTMGIDLSTKESNKYGKAVKQVNETGELTVHKNNKSECVKENNVGLDLSAKGSSKCTKDAKEANNRSMVAKEGETYTNVVKENDCVDLTTKESRSSMKNIREVGSAEEIINASKNTRDDNDSVDLSAKSNKMVKDVKVDNSVMSVKEGNKCTKVEKSADVNVDLPTKECSKSVKSNDSVRVAVEDRKKTATEGSKSVHVSTAEDNKLRKEDKEGRKSEKCVKDGCDSVSSSSTKEGSKSEKKEAENTGVNSCSKEVKLKDCAVLPVEELNKCTKENKEEIKCINLSTKKDTDPSSDIKVNKSATVSIQERTNFTSDVKTKGTCGASIKEFAKSKCDPKDGGDYDNVCMKEVTSLTSDVQKKDSVGASIKDVTKSASDTKGNDSGVSTKEGSSSTIDIKRKDYVGASIKDVTKSASDTKGNDSGVSTKEGSSSTIDIKRKDYVGASIKDVTKSASDAKGNDSGGVSSKKGTSTTTDIKTKDSVGVSIKDVTKSASDAKEIVTGGVSTKEGTSSKTDKRKESVCAPIKGVTKSASDAKGNDSDGVPTKEGTSSTIDIKRKDSVGVAIKDVTKSASDAKGNDSGGVSTKEGTSSTIDLKRKDSFGASIKGVTKSVNDAKGNDSGGVFTKEGTSSTIDIKRKDSFDASIKDVTKSANDAKGNDSGGVSTKDGTSSTTDIKRKDFVGASIKVVAKSTSDTKGKDLGGVSTKEGTSLTSDIKRKNCVGTSITEGTKSASDATGNDSGGAFTKKRTSSTSDVKRKDPIGTSIKEGTKSVSDAKRNDYGGDSTKEETNLTSDVKKKDSIGTSIKEKTKSVSDTKGNDSGGVSTKVATSLTTDVKRKDTVGTSNKEGTKSLSHAKGNDSGGVSTKEGTSLTTDVKRKDTVGTSIEETTMSLSDAKSYDSVDTSNKEATKSASDAKGNDSLSTSVKEGTKSKIDVKEKETVGISAKEGTSSTCDVKRKDSVGTSNKEGTKSLSHAKGNDSGEVSTKEGTSSTSDVKRKDTVGTSIKEATKSASDAKGKDSVGTSIKEATKAASDAKENDAVGTSVKGGTKCKVKDTVGISIKEGTSSTCDVKRKDSVGTSNKEETKSISEVKRNENVSVSTKNEANTTADVNEKDTVGAYMKDKPKCTRNVKEKPSVGSSVKESAEPTTDVKAKDSVGLSANDAKKCAITKESDTSADVCTKEGKKSKLLNNQEPPRRAVAKKLSAVRKSILKETKDSVSGDSEIISPDKPSLDVGHTKDVMETAKPLSKHEGDLISVTTSTCAVTPVNKELIAPLGTMESKKEMQEIVTAKVENREKTVDPPSMAKSTAKTVKSSPVGKYDSSDLATVIEDVEKPQKNDVASTDAVTSSRRARRTKTRASSRKKAVETVEPETPSKDVEMTEDKAIGDVPEVVGSKQTEETSNLESSDHSMKSANETTPKKTRTPRRAKVSVPDSADGVSDRKAEEKREPEVVKENEPEKPEIPQPVGRSLRQRRAIPPPPPIVRTKKTKKKQEEEIPKPELVKDVPEAEVTDEKKTPEQSLTSTLRAYRPTVTRGAAASRGGNLRARARGKGRNRGNRGSANNCGTPLDRVLNESVQSDSSQEQVETSENVVQSINAEVGKGNRGRRGARGGRGSSRGTGRGIVESSEDIVKRSPRLRAQRVRYEEEQKKVDEERAFLAELQRQQREEEKRLRQERKEQKLAMQQNGQAKPQPKGRAKKKVVVEESSESESGSESDGEEEEEEAEVEGVEKDVGKKKKKKKRRKKARSGKKRNKPWDYSSESVTSSESEEHIDHEQEEEEEEELVFNEKSDHEFSPESESDNDPAQPAKIRRARTARKAKSDSDAESDIALDDKPCTKCAKGDHPEWILLCDKCDVGYHTACLRPPLLIIPDGDWFCPPCQHALLLIALQEQLKFLDQALKKKEREEMRKKRLAYVGINLDNVLKAEKKEQSEEEEEENQPKRTCRARKDISYRFKEYDEMIQSAIQEEILAERGAGLGKGKDMSNIIEAEAEPEEENELQVVPNKKKPKHRRLTDLESPSEEEDGDHASDEDFKGSSTSVSQQSEEEELVEESDGSWHTGRRRHAPTRRSSRNRRRGYDDDFVCDEDESSDDYRTARRAASKRVSYRELSDSDERNDETWGKKRPKKRRKVATDSEEESEDSDWRGKSKKSKFKTKSIRGKRRWDSESDSEDDKPLPRTRGKKLNFVEPPAESELSEDEKAKNKKLRMMDFAKGSDDSSDEKEDEDDESEEEEDEDDKDKTVKMKDRLAAILDSDENDEDLGKTEVPETEKSKESEEQPKLTTVGNQPKLTTVANQPKLTTVVNQPKLTTVVNRPKTVFRKILKPPSSSEEETEEEDDDDEEEEEEDEDEESEEDEKEKPAGTLGKKPSVITPVAATISTAEKPVAPTDIGGPTASKMFPKSTPLQELEKVAKGTIDKSIVPDEFVAGRAPLCPLPEPIAHRASPAKLTMLDSCSSQSSPQSRLTVLEPFPPRSSIAASQFDPKVDRPIPLTSPGRPEVSDNSSPHPPGNPPPHMYSDYPPFVGPPYYSQGYGQQPSPEDRYSPQGYQPPHPPPPHHSQPMPPYPPPYHPQSSHYSCGPEGYSEEEQYAGPPQQYGGYSNYDSPSESDQGPPANGSYNSVSSLLQRRENVGEDDEFSGVNDLVSYITGSHENRL